MTVLWLVSQSSLTLVTPWTVAHQAPLPMGISRQEYSSGLTCPPTGDLPNPGSNLRLLLIILLEQSCSLVSFPRHVKTVFLNLSVPKVKVKSLSRVRLFATPWTVAYQAPPSMGFSRQEFWRGFPLSVPKNHLRRVFKTFNCLINLIKMAHNLATEQQQNLLKDTVFNYVDAS